MAHEGDGGGAGSESTSFVCKVYKSTKGIPHSKVVLRVDEHGISIVDKKGTQLVKYAFDDIVSWASSSGTFAFEVSMGVSTNKTQKKDQNMRFLFVTKEGVAIAEAMNKSVAKIVAEEERKFELEEKRYREELEKLESRESEAF